MSRPRLFGVATLSLFVAVALCIAIHCVSNGQQQIRADAIDAAWQSDSAACDCGAAKIGVPNDPVGRKTALERAEADRIARHKRAFDETRRIGLLWEGCKFSPSVDPSDSQFAQQEHICDLFAAKQAIAERRSGHYGWLLSDTRYRLVGWSATLVKVTQIAAGQTVDFIVLPRIATQAGQRTAFTPYSVKETWRVDNQKNVSCEKCEPVPGSGPGVMVD